jgi:hypothetical protein
MNIQEKLTYRVRRHDSTGWCWELVSQVRGVVATGETETEVQARIEAVRAVQERIGQPEVDG